MLQIQFSWCALVYRVYTKTHKHHQAALSLSFSYARICIHSLCAPRTVNGLCACIYLSFFFSLTRTLTHVHIRSFSFCITLFGCYCQRSNCPIYICVCMCAAIILLMLPEWRQISIIIIEDKCLWGKKFCINFIMTGRTLSIHKNVKIWIISEVWERVVSIVWNCQMLK